VTYDYEHHTWGGEVLGRTLDFPRLKYDLLASVVRRYKPRRLLEIGCGAGKFLGTLRRDFPGLALCGIDVSEAAIERARRTHPGVQFEVRSASDPGFADGSFDAVILLDVLEHVEDPEAVLSHVPRLLAAGGLFHAFVPCEAHSIYGLGGRLLGFHAKERTAGHIQRFTRAEVIDRVGARAQIVDARYSFHLLGSVMDYGLFVALLYPPLFEKFWRDNRFYAEPAATATEAGAPSVPLSTRLMNGLLGFGSALAYFESRLMARTPLLACGLHVTAITAHGAAVNPSAVKTVR
jgi:SAM-dependent methyltransferase